MRGVLGIVTVLGAVALAYHYLRLDDDLRRVAESALRKHCVPFDASVGRVRLSPGSGVTLYDVEVVETRPTGERIGVAKIDQVRIEGRFDLSALVSGKPEVRRVVAQRPRIAATRGADGAWNLAWLRPPPPGDQPPPVFELHDATFTAVAGDASLGVQHVNATVTPTTGPQRSFQLAFAAKQTLAAVIEGQATLDGSGKSLGGRLRIDRLAVTPARLATLRTLGAPLPPTPPVEAVMSVNAELIPNADGPPTWRTTFAVDEGRVALPGVGQPLTGVALTGAADAGGLRLDRATAKWGGATLTAAGSRAGWASNAPLASRVRVEQVDVGALPAWLMPRAIRVALGRFRPQGAASLAGDVAFDGERWSKRATVTLHEGGSFEDSEKFPYRVTSGSGTLRVNGGVTDDATPPTPGPTALAIDLAGSVEGAPIRVTGRLEDIEAKPAPGKRRPPMPLGWVEVAGNGVPITPRLVRAIPEEPARNFVESLHAAGRIDFRWRAERVAPADPMPQTAMDLRLVDCRVQYDRFPYPLRGVTGWVRQRGRAWSFTDLRSRSPQGGTLVTGAGSLRPDGDGHRLDLRFRGDAAPLDETLFAALPRNAQQAWAFLRPRGSLDFVADIRRDPGAIEPSVRLAMTPHDRSVSIEPAFYEGGRPYRLERLDGSFDWADDRLAMRGARAVNGRTTYSADGEWVVAPDGGWTLGLQALRADRMAFNRDFLLSAPPGLRSVIEGLDPQGAFDLFDTRLEVTQVTTPAPRISARWRVGVSCQQASLFCGVPVEGVSGVVRLGGHSDGVTAQTAGELDLDSAFWNDLQWTDIRGPLWADANDCLVGSGASERLKAEPRRLTAKAYGGDVAADCWVRYGSRPRYGIKVDAAGVDVARLSSEWLGRREALQGDLNGTVELQGAGESIYGLTGVGRVEVNDADLYELPLLLSLLKYLRNRAPDNTAFNRLEAEFAINADEVRFERLNLLGDAVSLYGKGTANLQKEIDLTFASIVGRNELAVPVLKAFVSSASEQLLRLRVGGTMDAPVIRREVLPLVGNMLEQLQAEFSRPPTRPLRSAGATPRRGATARRTLGAETVR